MRTSRRGDAIKLLEPLEQSNQLGTTEQFILAQTYLAERLVDKYRGQMQKLLGSGVKNPRQLAHFVDFLLDRGSSTRRNTGSPSSGRSRRGP